MIRTTYLENLTKNLVFTITTTKELGKLKTTTISQMKKFTSPFSLTVLNTRNLSNVFHCQTSLKEIIFSFLKYGVKLLVISLGNALTMHQMFFAPKSQLLFKYSV